MHGKKQAIVPYFISAHPGCTLEDMVEVALFLRENDLRVEQVQEFTPTPGSLATCIYHTGRDPYTGEAVHVPRDPGEKKLHKALLLYHLPEQRRAVIEALRLTGREEARDILLGSGKTSRSAASRAKKDSQRGTAGRKRESRKPPR